MYCKACGRKLKDGAKFCSGCGKGIQIQHQNGSMSTPPATNAYRPVTAPMQSSGQRPRKTSGVVLAIVVVIVLIIAAATFIKPYIQSGFNGMFGGDNGSSIVENNGKDASADTRKVDKTEIENGVKNIENAFKSKDVEQITKLIHPQMAQNYKAVFEEHKEELDKIAALIESRKPVALYVDYAEYEVSDGSGTFEMIFEKCNDVWVLSSF